MRLIVIALPFCFGLLVAPAQVKTPPKTDLGFDASEAPPPDPMKGKPLARVLDQYIYSDQPFLKLR
jgi:hypothetical protein